MASGKPDWNRAITMQGKYDDNYLPVLVDDTGQLYIAITGHEVDVSNLPSDYFKASQNIGGSDNSIGVAQDNNDRNMKGDDEGIKRFVAVDSSGVILSRMKGAYSGSLKDISVDSDGLMLARMKGYDGSSLQDVLVDTNGNIISNIKGVSAGEEIVSILDDCGDTDAVADWSQAVDGEAPVEDTTYVKQGTKSMKLGIDTSLSVGYYAYWRNTTSHGDYSAYINDYLYMWVYLPTLDYLRSPSNSIQVQIGDDNDNKYRFGVDYDSLVVGWNLIKLDLSNPDYSWGTPTFSDISWLQIEVYEVSDNDTDFELYVDNIVFVRRSDNYGNLVSVGLDADGRMLSRMQGAYAGHYRTISVDADGYLKAKMTGEYGGSNKTIATDSNGVMKANLSAQDLDPLNVNPLYGPPIDANQSHNHTGVESYELVSISGPGVVLGGFVRHDCTSAGHENCSVYLCFDGATVSALSFTLLNKWGVTDQYRWGIYLIHYDSGNNEFAVALPFGYYFASSFKIYINEITDANANSYASVMYAQF